MLSKVGEGEVIVQLSCIYETITIEFLEKFKKFLINFLNFQKKKFLREILIPLKYFCTLEGLKNNHV